MMLQDRPVYPPFDGGVETSTALSILFGVVGAFLIGTWAWSVWKERGK